MKSLITLAVLIVLLFSVSITIAQTDLRRWQVGVNGGVFVYQGDLAPSMVGSYKTLKPAVGLYLSRILNPSFILRTNLAFGRLKGNDAKYDHPYWRRDRNLSFVSGIVEISELLVWNMFSNNSNEIGNRLSPYVFAGLGLSVLKINRNYNNMSKDFFIDFPQVQAGFNADIAARPPGPVVVLPAGVGVEYYLNNRMSLTAETNFRYTFTDYIDGFSQGANPSKKDFYQSHTIGLLYRLGKKNQLDCPVVKY